MKKIWLSSVLLLFIVMAACSAATTFEIKKPTQVQTTVPQATIASTQLQNSSGIEKIVSFSKDIMPLFAQYSDSHHSTGTFYVLETYEGVMKDVVPGNPEASKLYQRMIGQGGPVMPPSGKLPDDLLKLVYDWIKQGAKNN